MDKVKQFFSTAKAKIVAIFGIVMGLIGVFLLMFLKKRSEPQTIEALQQVDDKAEKKIVNIQQQEASQSQKEAQALQEKTQEIFRRSQTATSNDLGKELVENAKSDE